ncbi:MAG TPA: PilZ domain-containing protein [Kofleriaceae bacterium]|nr:PilZ domain-containing protein [Kofleriaceae bacterium]
MRLLLARFRSRAELLERFLATRDNGGIFLPTRRAIEPGEAVLVDVRLAELRDHLLVRGVVVERQRGRRNEGVRAGLYIEFLASEAGKRDHLLALARGEEPAAAGQRRHRRLPIELRVDWRVPNQTERYISLASDIGIGGAFLRTSEPVPEGTPVVIELRPPGANTPQSIEGRVAWHRETPGMEGVGVEFRCRDIGGMRRLRELVRRIERHEVTPAT